MDVWRLEGARQASYGIGPKGPNLFETVKESFGELDLSVEYGRGVEIVETLDDDATVEERWNTLARLENWRGTHAEQEAVRAADRLADEEDSNA